jgi:hypothetical protein
MGETHTISRGETVQKVAPQEAPQAHIDAKKPKSRRKGQFAPGNPYRFALGQGGRAEGSEDRTNKLSVAYGETLEQRVEDGTMTRAQAIALRMAHIATTGKPGAAVIAAKELADRTEGKPVQAIQVSQTIDSHTAARLLDIAQMLRTKQLPVLEAEIVQASDEEPEGK